MHTNSVASAVELAIRRGGYVPTADGKTKLLTKGFSGILSVIHNDRDQTVAFVITNGLTTNAHKLMLLVPTDRLEAFLRRLKLGVFKKGNVPWEDVRFSVMRYCAPHKNLSLH